MKFYEILKKYFNMENEEQKDKLTLDQEAICASFSFYIENNNNSDPVLEVAVKDFSNESLDSLAHLIAPMSYPDFFYLVLDRLKHDFVKADRNIEYIKFLTKITELKRIDSGDKPCITPLDLSRR